jgi:hypothetical protein
VIRARIGSWEVEWLPRSRGDEMMRNLWIPFATVALAASIAIGAAGCRPSVDAAEVSEHVIRPADLDALVLGRTTPGEIEGKFGSPDRLGMDGAFTYFTKRRPSGAQDSVTFRFESGTLVKICTARAA